MPTVYIALGANIPSPAGLPEATLAAAVEQLRLLGDVLACSAFYRTEPVGYVEQPEFVNAAVALRTDLDPEVLLTHLLQIEAEFGRDRTGGIKNGPRSLDLDLLLYGDLVLTSGSLELPHPRMTERLFVLEPMVEIAPELIHPKYAKSMSQLLSEKVNTIKESL